MSEEEAIIMWIVCGNALEMTEGDYGIELPVTISGAVLGENDALKFTFKAAADGDVLLEKDYTDPQENTVFLKLTEEESALFEANKTYCYSLDWYQDGEFLCNVIPRGNLRVVNKI